MGDTYLYVAYFMKEGPGMTSEIFWLKFQILILNPLPAALCKCILWPGFQSLFYCFKDNFSCVSLLALQRNYSQSTKVNLTDFETRMNQH